MTWTREGGSALQGPVDTTYQDVVVIGLGYVGLTLAVTLARAGLRVTGVDKSPHVLAALNDGCSHFFEEELDRAIKEVIRENFHVSNVLSRDARPTAFVISVGTPVDPATKQPLLSQINAAIDELAPVLRAGDLVVLRSTVPIGTSRNHVLERLVEVSRLRPGVDLRFAFAPERTVEGKAMEELRNLPQIIGGYDESSVQACVELFGRYNADLVILPDLEHAEMLKTVDNSYRDVAFSYANQMALICEGMNLNFSLIREVANYHYPRNAVPMSSPGVGGACLTKDPYLLIDICKKKGINHQLISAGREVNEYVPVHLAKQLVAAFVSLGVRPSTAKVFVLGVAFKGLPPTSDVRFSSALDFAAALHDEKVSTIYAHDPYVRDGVIRSFGLQPCSVAEGICGAHAIVVMTNHVQWKEICLDTFRHEVHHPCVVMDHWHMLANKQPDDGTYHFGAFGVAPEKIAVAPQYLRRPPESVS